MKKLLCALVMSAALIGVAVSQEAESAEASENAVTAEKTGGFSLHNMRIEAGIPLVLLGIGADFRVAYDGVINDVWSWSAGVETHFCGYITGSNVSVLGYGAIWRKNLYLSYGMGLGLCDGDAGFIPLDLRLGYQNAFSSKESGLSSKWEIGLFGIYAPDSASFSDSGTTHDDPAFGAAPGISWGLVYRF